MLSCSRSPGTIDCVTNRGPSACNDAWSRLHEYFCLGRVFVRNEVGLL